MDDNEENYLDQQNYRPIICLPMMWKILTVQIKEIYYSLECHWLFQEEQKGRSKGAKGTDNWQYIDQLILKEVKKMEP